MIESTFNFMDDVVTDARSSLNCDSLDGIQTIKYYLLSLGKNACDAFGSKNPSKELLDIKIAR